MSRANYLTVTQNMLLADWGRKVYQSFYYEAMPYLVGSCLARADFRDVDVRVMMTSDEYAAITSVMRASRVNLGLSLWGQQVTGLPIDCQIQTFEEGNSMVGRTDRHALGIDVERHDDDRNRMTVCVVDEEADGQ